MLMKFKESTLALIRLLTTAENTYKALRVPAEECGRRSFALVRTVVEKEDSPFLSGLVATNEGICTTCPHG